MKLKLLTTKCWLLLVIPFSLFFSCRKFIDIAPPATQAEASKVFATDQTATAAAIGLYYQMISANLNFMSGAMTIYPGLSSDDLVNVSSNSDYDAFKNNNIPITSSTVNSKLWGNAYRNIYQANSVLEGLVASNSLSTPIKEQLEGEMLFTRALHYFYLVNLFGDVPYETATGYRENSTLPRTPAATINAQMISDLLRAKQLLRGSYSVSTNSRPNLMSVTALLARYYLFQNDWSNAGKQADEVISSGNYRLESNLTNVFLATSVETIYQLARPTNNTVEGSVFIPISGTVRPAFTITSSLLSKFEPNDNRKTNWLKSNIVSGVAHYYPYKYKVRSSTTITENSVVIRLAEIYLIRSEARAQLNDLTGSRSDLNIVRTRAGLTTTTAVTRPELVSAVLEERQLEFFAEWGHRWFDLKRTGAANTILGALKGSNWQPEDQLYPIPQAQILLNPVLTQNKGY
ncbi:RagB/SusD family nutrient uptake outer membrane protein [Mucilaginibacter sp.]|uniref:RagB/SusD family nutrient uptake outer membrane protein n=1 Tax=Mucilaginibacter sp. TaxID=1882438 RepID=UPI0035BBA639